MRRKLFLFGFFGLFCVLILQRDVVFAKGMEAYLNRKKASLKWNIESLERSRNVLSLKKMALLTSYGELLVPEVSITCSVSLFPFQFRPEVKIPTLSFTLQKETGNSDDASAFIFLEGSLVDLHLTIEEGVLKTVEGQSFVFGFEPKKEPEEIGLFWIKETKEANWFCSVFLKREGKSIVSKLEIDQGKITDLLSFTSLVPVPFLKGWKGDSGLVSLNAECSFHPVKGVTSLEGKVDLQDVKLLNDELGVDMYHRALKGSFVLLPEAFSQEETFFWKKMDLFATFEESSVFLKKQKSLVGFQEALGEVRLHPSEDPFVKMSGKMVSSSELIPFEVEGKGALLADQSYWVQMQADFFLKKSSPKIFLSLCQTLEQEHVIGLEWSFFSPEIFQFLKFLPPLIGASECVLEEGSFSGKILAHLEKSKLKSVEFSECSSPGISFSIPSKNLWCKMDSFLGSGMVIESKEGEFILDSLLAEVQNGEFTTKFGQIEGVSGRVEVVQGEMESSYVEGFYQGVFGRVQMLGSDLSDLIHLECKGSLGSLTEKIFPEIKQEINQETLFDFRADVSDKEGCLLTLGTLSLIGKNGVKEEINAEVFLEKKISRKVADLFSDWDFFSCQGSFKADQLSSDTCISWSPLGLKGSLGLSGEFDGEKVDLVLKDIELEGQLSPWNGSLKMGEDDAVNLSYIWNTRLWKGTVPLDSFVVQNKSLNLLAEGSKTKLFLEGDSLWTDAWQAKILDLAFQGSLLVDSTGIHLASKAFEGRLGSLSSLFAQVFPEFKTPNLDGNFSVSDQSCFFSSVKKEGVWKNDWKASLSLQDLSYDLGKVGKVTEVNCDVAADSEGRFLLKNIKGKYLYSDIPAFFVLSDFDASLTRPSDFSLLVKDEKREWVRLEGRVEKQKEEFLFSFTPLSHLFGMAVTLSPLTIDQKGAISPIKLASSIQLEKLPSYVTMWKEMGITQEDLSFESLSSLSGTLQMQSSYDFLADEGKVLFKSSSVSYKNRALGEVKGTLQGSLGKWKLDSCSIGPCQIKATCQIRPLEWKLDAFSVESPEIQFLFKGSYFPNSSKVQIPSFAFSTKVGEKTKLRAQGSFEGIACFKEEIPLAGKGKCSVTADFTAIHLAAIKDLVFTLDSKEGVQTEKVEWNLVAPTTKYTLGKVSAKKIQYFPNTQNLLLTGGSLSIPKESQKIWKEASFLPKDVQEIFIQQGMDLTADLEVSPQVKKLSGTFKNGKYLIGGLSLDLKQIQCLFEKDVFYGSCQTLLQEEPLLFQIRSKVEKEPSIQVLIKESLEKSGIALQLKTAPNGTLFCEKVEGECKGVSLQMIHKKQEAEKRLYDLKLSVDFSKAQGYMTKSWQEEIKKWKLGQGYTWKGSLALDKSSFKIISLSGELKGEHFECLERTFDSFKAKMEFTENKGRIQEVRLEDDVAKISIKTIDFSLNSDTKQWDLTAPLIQIKSLAPALLLKGGKERGVEIQNLSLYDLKGQLNRLDSFQGKGSLYFSSLEKKEFSFWDVPLSLIKDWGLDPGLLTPVIGEADFILNKGRFYFTLLRNVYSEGKRSQFYLANPGTEAYLGLDGTWHVDLGMKQNVVWKVTEDLILSIRGTVDKPKYSFKKDKNSS